ncbi:DUF397 domain-containing protein [Spongiactinospora sp. TRM90649]|uniref:DUF397 domain-containing protein n=1 Tax=Spongiactinospora sp. TRM90649 TaxID=3031114 RepID=UPI0023F831B3|nr:DUF397 domain-containing protein [Spongiactinospora sp. TRM90649]MDF5758388.1 DUF397 domain-containing protein [Spongiactinospora sp. TRM90649]
MNTSPADPDKFTTWRTSSRSGGDGNCVEVAFASDGVVGVRDSKNRSGPRLEFAPAEWQAFIGGVKDGGFDPM